MWRLQYREERYLRDLSVAELFERAGDLMTVSLKHSPDGKIALVANRHAHSEIERFTHVLEEFKIRGINWQPGFVKRLQLPKPNSAKVRRGLEVLRHRNLPDAILVKFGTLRHMTSLFFEGKGRISLARTYADPSLGYARVDDESQISVYVHPMDSHRLMVVTHNDTGSRGEDVEVPYLGSVQINLQATSDFYVYCMAKSCDVRMFDDFTTATSEVDACVIITDPDEFKRRISEATSPMLSGWNLLDDSVTYVDPFFARFHLIAPHFCKHFRFGYQKEHRLLWLPSKEPDAVRSDLSDHVYFDVGPLTDCAELICL